MRATIARLFPALCAAAIGFVPAPAWPAAARVLSRSLPGFTVEIALPAKSTDEDVDRVVKVAQAMYDQFRLGKHPFHGLEDLLDVSEPGKAPRPKGREVAIGFTQIDRDCLKALVGVGFKVRMVRLHTLKVPSEELAQRISASYLLAQSYGGPLKDVPAAPGMEKGVPASLLVSLDRLSPSSAVWALRLRGHIADIADAKEKVLVDEATSPEDQSRARLTARVWHIVFHGWPFGRELLEGVDHLGAGSSGLVELMAQGCAPELFKEFLATATAVLKSKGLEPALEAIKRYAGRAYDLPTPEALLAAVADADLARVQKLLKAGASPSAREKDGESALMMAIGEEKPEIARVLAEAGADLTATDHEGRSPLELAAWKRQTALVKALAAKADLRGKAKASGEKSLVEALRNSDLVAVQALLDAGADPDARDAKDTPAIVLAARAQKPAELFEALFKAKVTVRISDKDGMTPLMVVAEQGQIGLVKTLLAHGADAWATNKRGKSAADLAEAADASAVAAELKKQPKRK